LIFYISEKRPELLDAVCDKLRLAVTKIRNTHIKNFVISNAGAFTLDDKFVIDLSSIKDSPDEIIEAVEALRRLNGNAGVIIVADSEPPGSSLLNRLFDIGVYDIVINPDEPSLMKSLTTGYTRNETALRHFETPKPAVELPRRPATLSHEIINADMNFKKRKPYVTVAICGAEPHIGVTHNALLMAKFFSHAGFKVCYLEANKRRKIMYLASIYPVNANERKRLIQFEGIDIYFDFNFEEISGMGYDFYIYDMGRLDEMDAASFMSKDMRFVAGGVKAWEIPSYNTVLGLYGVEQSFSFIINFAPPHVQDSGDDGENKSSFF
jgi:hypothetical protein